MTDHVESKVEQEQRRPRNKEVRLRPRMERNKDNKYNSLLNDETYTYIALE